MLIISLFVLGPACIKYQDIFLEPMLSGLQSSEAEVRQAAAYGCGVLAQFGGAQFAAACAKAVPLLAAVIAEPDARSVENLNATENAISAVAKIIKYNHDRIDRDEIIRHWYVFPIYGLWISGRFNAFLYSECCGLNYMWDSTELSTKLSF